MFGGKWHKLQGDANPAQGVGKGVYRVRVTDDRGNAVSIPRACATDREGTVYIGQGHLQDRVGLLMDITREERPKEFHCLTTNWLQYELDRIGDGQHLEVQWEECEDPAKLEKQEIENYKRSFGDIPPGNLKTG